MEQNKDQSGAITLERAGFKLASHVATPGGPIMASVTDVYEKDGIQLVHSYAMGGESWSFGAAVRGEAVAEFNINDMMIVTLTEFGAQIWNSRYDGIPIPAPLIPKPVLAGHVLKDQMWDLMKTFGPHIHLGGEMPFLKAIMAHEKVSARAADALDSQPTDFEDRPLKARVLRNELAIIIGCQDGRTGAEKADAVLNWIETQGQHVFVSASSQPTEGDGCDECRHTYCLSGEICRHCGDVNGTQGWKGGRQPTDGGGRNG